MTEVVFAGCLTEAEFRELQSLAMRKIWFVLAVIFLVLLGLNLLSGGGRTFVENPFAALATWTPVMLMIPVGIAIHRLTVRRHWKSNKILQIPVNGTVSEDEITWNVEGLSSSRLPWTLLLKYRSSESMLLIYHGVNQVLYFPRRYFQSDEEWARFQQIVASKLPRK